MNKKQKEAKRKNAQAHQKKVKELGASRLQNRVDRKQLIAHELFKPDLVSELGGVIMASTFVACEAFVSWFVSPSIPPTNTSKETDRG